MPVNDLVEKIVMHMEETYMLDIEYSEAAIIYLLETLESWGKAEYAAGYEHGRFAGKPV